MNFFNVAGGFVTDSHPKGLVAAGRRDLFPGSSKLHYLQSPIRTGRIMDVKVRKVNQ
jgi:hypothetical protein